jgi:hypothetical protein
VSNICFGLVLVVIRSFVKLCFLFVLKLIDSLFTNFNVFVGFSIESGGAISL